MQQADPLGFDLRRHDIDARDVSARPIVTLNEAGLYGIARGGTDSAATAETRAARAPVPVYNTPATAWGGSMGEENFDDALTPWSTLTDGLTWR